MIEGLPTHPYCTLCISPAAPAHLPPSIRERAGYVHRAAISMLVHPCGAMAKLDNCMNSLEPKIAAGVIDPE